MSSSALLLALVLLGAPPLLRLPPGFVAEAAAVAPQIVFPMFAAFDDRGRLFVAESSGLDLYAELAAQTRKCRVSLLEDLDGDGRFEKAGVFADQLVFPMGLAWHEGRLYVADPPQLLALEDLDGDRRADRRTVILEGFGHTDNGSLHGLVFGPDERLYLTMGSADGYQLRREGGATLHGKTGALIRCWPDGSDPEVLCRGFENLVEIEFLAGGEIVGTDNWFQLPLGGVRDALVHLVDGGLYPRFADTTGGTRYPLTGVELPPISRFPAVALSGLVRYRGAGFPPELRGSLFTAQHNARAVGRHAIERSGSTFLSRDEVFVSSDDPDFHPSDVLEDADGSLLVVDTGGWYVQHCPTGRIRNSRASGGIYRVRFSGASRLEDPWGLAVEWEKASIGDLSDPRPVRRRKTRRELIRRGETAVRCLSEALALGLPPPAAEEALWALHGIGTASARAALRSALSSPSPDARALAARALGSLRDAGSAALLAGRLADEAPSVRLAAAEALARCGGGTEVPALLEALAGAADPHLEHAAVHALHHAAGQEALAAALDHRSPRVQKGALALLEQPPRRGAPKESVLARIASPDASLRSAALDILLAHPAWADAARDELRRCLERPALTVDQQAALRSLVAAFRRDGAFLEEVAAAIEGSAPGVPLETRAVLIEAAGRIGAGTALERIVAALRQILGGRGGPATASLRRAAVRTAALLRARSAEPELRRLAEDASEPDDLRVEALAFVVRSHPELSASAWELLLGRLALGTDPLARLRAAEVIRAAKLDPARSRRWTEIQAPDPLLAPHVAASGEELEGRRRRLVELEPLLAGGSPERGREVFFGPRVACGACHSVGSSGGRVGPDLTKVGAVRAGRDILESIVFPSSTFAQGYEPYQAATSDGRALFGLLARQDESSIVLREPSGAETALDRSEIKDLRRAELSVMPEGLERLLTASELRDLLAFLLANR